jgi:group I intron endonuclease
MIIYKITNTVNRKCYIGFDTSFNGHRWYHHCWAYDKPNVIDYDKVLYRAFRKYGLENFKYEELEQCISHQHCLEREVYWIALYMSNSPAFGYNVTTGGEGYRNLKKYA